MATLPPTASFARTSSSAGSTPWFTLAVLSTAQLMVVLDDTVVNIALPTAQADLGFAASQRQWVVTGYAAGFAALLPLGGRLVDRFGARRLLIVGSALFVSASLLGGAASSLLVLVGARVGQGMGAACLAPAALAGLTVAFPAGETRRRAFAVFAAISACGALVGLLLGGLLTGWSWRWSLLINAVIALPVILGARTVPSQRRRNEEAVDVVGTGLALAGLLLLVAGLSRIDLQALPILSAVAGLVLLGVFVRRQRHSSAPLLPLTGLGSRSGALTALLLGYAGMFTVFVFLTYVLQRDFGFSPLGTGLAYLPMTAAIGAGSGLGAVLTRSVSVGVVIPAGMVLAAAGLSWLAAMDARSSYVGAVLGPTLVLGVGLGAVFSTAVSTATADVEAQDAGAASALVNVAQQIGVALGTALLSGIAAGVVDQGRDSIVSAVAAFGAAAVIFLVGSAASALLLGRHRPADHLEVELSRSPSTYVDQQDRP